VTGYIENVCRFFVATVECKRLIFGSFSLNEVTHRLFSEYFLRES